MTKGEFIFIFRVLGITSRNEMKIKLYAAAAARENSLCVNVRALACGKMKTNLPCAAALLFGGTQGPIFLQAHSSE